MVPYVAETPGPPTKRALSAPMNLLPKSSLLGSLFLMKARIGFEPIIAETLPGLSPQWFPKLSRGADASLVSPVNGATASGWAAASIMYETAAQKSGCCTPPEPFSVHGPPEQGGPVWYAKLQLL